MTVEQIDAVAGVQHEVFFHIYRVASQVLYLYNKDTKKVKVQADATPLFYSTVG